MFCCHLSCPPHIEEAVQVHDLLMTDSQLLLDCVAVLLLVVLPFVSLSEGRAIVKEGYYVLFAV
jgi:hypothetical protein